MNGVNVRDSSRDSDNSKSIEYALKKLSRICDPVLAELKEYNHYEKPSEKKRRKLNKALRANMKVKKPF
jgi:ribosomal protein S21